MLHLFGVYRYYRFGRCDKENRLCNKVAMRCNRGPSSLGPCLRQPRLPIQWMTSKFPQYWCTRLLPRIVTLLSAVALHGKSDCDVFSCNAYSSTLTSDHERSISRLQHILRCTLSPIPCGL